jgi:hypothetical protein
MVGGSTSNKGSEIIKHGGISTDIAPMIPTFQKIFPEKVMFQEPITKGAARECQENARVEYWKQKNAGNNPTYVIGEVQNIWEESIASATQRGLSNPETVSRFISPHKVVHAWVEVNGRIIDPTPFMIEGNPGNLRAASTARFSRYISKVRVSAAQDRVLLEPLKLPSQVRRRLEEDF